MTTPFSRAMLAALMVCALPEAARAQAPADIGTLPGYTLSRPKNVNDRGDIVGQTARAGPEEQAALWSRTSDGYAVEALPALDGLTRSDARAFARHGAPVGFSSLIGGGVSVSRAVVWRDDPSGLRVAVDLEPPPGFTDAAAFDANHAGLIVGEASNPAEVINGSVVRHAVAWVPNHDDSYDVLDLGVPDGFDVTSASGVNEMGEIVGTARRLEVDGSQTAAVVVWRRPFKRHGRCHSETFVLDSHPDLPRNLNPAISTAGLVVAQADRSTPGQATTSRPLYWVRAGRGFSGPYALRGAGGLHGRLRHRRERVRHDPGDGSGPAGDGADPRLLAGGRLVARAPARLQGHPPRQPARGRDRHGRPAQRAGRRRRHRAGSPGRLDRRPRLEAELLRHVVAALQAPHAAVSGSLSTAGRAGRRLLDRDRLVHEAYVLRLPPEATLAMSGVAPSLLAPAPLGKAARAPLHTHSVRR